MKLALIKGKVWKKTFNELSLVSQSVSTHLGRPPEIKFLFLFSISCHFIVFKCKLNKSMSDKSLQIYINKILLTFLHFMGFHRCSILESIFFHIALFPHSSLSLFFSPYFFPYSNFVHQNAQHRKNIEFI